MFTKSMSEILSCVCLWILRFPNMKPDRWCKNAEENGRFRDQAYRRLVEHSQVVEIEPYSGWNWPVASNWMKSISNRPDLYGSQTRLGQASLLTLWPCGISSIFWQIVSVSVQVFACLPGISVPYGTRMP